MSKETYASEVVPVGARKLILRNTPANIEVHFKRVNPDTIKMQVIGKRMSKAAFNKAKNFISKISWHIELNENSNESEIIIIK